MCANLSKNPSKDLTLHYQKWGALIQRAEIIPLNLIRVMPAEEKRVSNISASPGTSDYDLNENHFIMKRGFLYLFKFLLIMVLNTVLCNVSAQEITGKVTDEKGDPLAGAAVAVKNTYIGTYTEADGTYLLKLSKDGNYTLNFSFIGFKTSTQEVTLKNKLMLNVTLVQGEIMTGEVIVSGIRAGNKTPVTFTNVGQEVIAKSNNGQDIPYLIGLTPSLVETSETGTGIGYTGLRIRGTDGSRINVTMDGIPLNDAESQQVFWVDLPDLASSVDNIQVQRGVGTSSNGSGAFGASINIESKNPELLPFAGISTTLGSFNTRKNTFMAGTGLLSGKFAFQVRYSDIKSDGYIERTGVSNRSAYVSGIYISGRSTLKANVILGEEHTGISWWGVPKEMLGIDRRYNPAGEYIDQNGNITHYQNESDNYKQNHLQLIYRLDFNKYTRLNAALHYTFGQGYYEEYRQNQLYSDYGLNPVQIGNRVIDSTDLIRRKWLSNDFYGVVYSLSYRKERIDAVFGGGINSYKGDNYGTVIWMRNAGTTGKDWEWYLNRSTKDEINIYGKLNYKFSDRINGFGDLNYRYVYYKMAGPDDDLRTLSENHTFNFFNPKAGVFLTISPNQDGYLSFAVAHKEPTRSDYKVASGDNSVTPLPETLFDGEAGYNFRTGKSAVGINLFAMFYKDQLIPTGKLSDVGYPVMTNVKDSYRTGIEFSAGIRPVKLINWQFNMTLSRNKIPGYIESYQDYITADNAYVNKTRNLGEVDIAYSPSLTASSDIAFSFPENIKIHFITKYVRDQYFDNTMSSARRLDRYVVNNLRIDFNPVVRNVKNIDIQLFVNNLLNNIYSSNAYGGSYYQDGIESTWSYYFPQAGINWLVKLGFTF
jgi:iron complex outermembrane receptor protein